MPLNKETEPNRTNTATFITIQVRQVASKDGWRQKSKELALMMMMTMMMMA